VIIGDKMNDKIRLEALNPHYLRLIIMPTESCNFRCTYCYEDYSIGRMPDTISQGIKNFVEYRAEHDMTYLSIDYFGGEPLLVVNPIIFDLAKTFQQMSRDYGFIYSSGMTTNAYKLTLPIFKDLVRMGVTKYQIALDGTASQHNTTRILANGRGTFDVIWNNLLAIRNSDMDANITLRIHYMPHTIDNIQELLYMIGNEFNNDDRFSVFLKKVGRLGGENDHEIPLFINDEWIKIEKQLLEILPVEIRSRSHIESSILNYACYASKANSLVIRADGSLAKCTVAFNDKRNNIGSLQPDGQLHIDQQKFRRWLTGITENRPEVMACPVKFI
jgi:uncharacterized protein